MSSRYRASFYDPDTERHPLPTYPWRWAPEGLATVRQLRAAGVRAGGQDPAAQVLWQGVGGVRRAVLYRVDAAKPKRTATTPAQQAAIEAALTAWRTCRTCGQVRPCYIPRSLGECVTCADDQWEDAA